MKTLLIVGGGAEQITAYQLAKKRGLKVVGSDRDINAPALRLADYIILASTRDAKETLKKVISFNKKVKIDGVMTVANDVPLTVSKIANALGLQSISINSAKLFSDKLLMKEAFFRNGVACPWFSAVKDLKNLNKLAEDRSHQRYVLKPTDGRGARGVLFIDNDIDLTWAYEEASKYSESDELILEKFEGGIQLSTESFILNERCFTPAISERNYGRFAQFSPNIIEDGGTVPADLSSELVIKINELILSGAKALGVDYGQIKGDLVLDHNGDPKIIELAARLSGGWFASHQITAATGVNLVDIVISYALRDNIEEHQLKPSKKNSCAIRYWFPKSGKIKKISGEAELKKIPGLIKYEFYKKPGDIQSKINMHSDRFGFVIVEGPNRTEAIARVEKAISCIDIEVDEFDFSN